MHTEAPALDYSVVDSIRELQQGGSANLLEQLTLAFFDDASGHLADLSDAVANRDLAGVRRAAHSLKGICGAIGAQHMAALSLALEMKALDATVDADLALEIHVEFDRVESALRAVAGMSK